MEEKEEENYKWRFICWEEGTFGLKTEEWLQFIQLKMTWLAMDGIMQTIQKDVIAISTHEGRDMQVQHKFAKIYARLIEKNYVQGMEKLRRRWKTVEFVIISE